MHSQDMKDQDGDRSRGRRTAPIVLGDVVARSTIAISFWSVVDYLPMVLGHRN